MLLFTWLQSIVIYINDNYPNRYLYYSAAPHNNKLAAGCKYKYMKCNGNRMLLVTTINQLSINPKDGKNVSTGILTQVHHYLPGLMLLPVSPLGKLPEKLRPQVDINQIGLCVLQRSFQMSLTEFEGLRHILVDKLLHTCVLSLTRYSSPFRIVPVLNVIWKFHSVVETANQICLTPSAGDFAEIHSTVPS